MPGGLTIPAILVAAVISFAGLWWFTYILKDMRRMRPGPRYVVYAAIWLAYFLLILILMARAGPQ
ncbi:MAG: hypothetical protein ACE5FO_08935 [Parvularculaceae bacterium]